MSKTSNFKSAKPKIYHFIWWIPHYRTGIFSRLSQNPHIEFNVVAGDNSQVWGGAHVTSASEAGKADSINWQRVESMRIQGPLFHGYEWQGESVKIICREKPDAVICHGNKSISNFLIRMICRFRRIPLLEWSQGVRGPEKQWKWILRRYIYLCWAKGHLLYGSFARDWYASHGFNQSRLFVVNNSLDYDQQVKIRERITPADIRNTRYEFGLNQPDSRLVFYSGRLEKDRRIAWLIKAIKHFKQKGKEVKLVLIGGGREEAYLKQCALSEELGHEVVFYGPCFEEEALGRIMMASDLCVVPGHVGLICMHSMVYGTPVFTCKNTLLIHAPEVEAIREGVTGAFYREGDFADFLRKLDALLYPVSCKSRMREGCMEVIDKYYNPEYQEKIIIQALNSVLPPSKQIPFFRKQR